MGAPYIDYIVADEFVIPPDARSHYAERVVYLPGCFQANEPLEPAADPPTRRDAGLPDDALVFCCFNSAHKLTPSVYSLWCELLREVPGSVLWLLAERPAVRDKLLAEALARGVAAERLVFAPRLAYAPHLARLPLADLFLDTFPFNAGATASDALRAGVPVLTCAGRALAARMAGSLLRALELPELVTHATREYHERALRLARAPAELRQLRARLAVNSRTCGVFDSAAFCRHLERAYRIMWERQQRGGPATSFAVAP
jgi:predicted O-linked N-acetylglucosamine transferase (SPINDLY family)